MSLPKRITLIADAKVQGTLVFRLVTYWCFAWLVVIGLAVLVSFIFGATVEGVSVGEVIGRMLSYFWLPVLISIMVLPILIRDCLRLSNRFTGPVLRIRRALKGLADGDPVTPIKLREGDFWQETADDFNRVLQLMRPASAQADAQAQSEITAR